MEKLDAWIDGKKTPLLIAIAALAFAGWLGTYLIVPYPAVFGDEFSTYALTRAVADPGYNLADYGWLFQLRSSMPVFGAVYQFVHFRDGSPLAWAQFLNALFLAGTLPLVWITARRLLTPLYSVCAVVAYSTVSTHILGALFIAEPLFYLGFWAVVAVTVIAVRGGLVWSVAAGVLAGLLTLIKPHGVMTAGWSLLLLLGSAFIPTQTDARPRRWARSACWFVAYLLVRQLVRWAEGPLGNGSNFYQDVLHSLGQPSVFITHLLAALGGLKSHVGLYGVAFGPWIGLALAALAGTLFCRRRERPFRPEDLVAMSFLFLAFALLCMALAFSSFVNELNRVHGRYWSYSLLPIALSGAYFAYNPFRKWHWSLRSLPLAFTIAAGGCAFFGLSPDMQVTPNDCPEIHWIYLGFWQPGWQRWLVIAVAVGGTLVSALFLIRPQLGLAAALGFSLVVNVTGDVMGMEWLKRNSINNGVQSRLSCILQSHKKELLDGTVVLLAPRYFMTGGAMFGLPRIPHVVERPVGSGIGASDLPANATVLGVIGNYKISADLALTWEEGDYSVYRLPTTNRQQPP